MTTTQRILVLVICLVFVLVSAAGQVTTTPRQENQLLEEGRYLRNNQRNRNRENAPLSGGVLLEKDPLLVPLNAVKSAPAESEALIATEPLRVNSDLLAQDFVAQRATQAEPYLHANPENPDNLLAGWQEN